MKKILIVEDHAVVRMGIDFLITESFTQVEVHQASNFPAALNVLGKLEIDLIILDIAIPGGENSRMIKKIRSIQPNAKILIFSGSEEDIYALHYMNAGANGFLSKSASEEEHRVAIMAVLNSGKYISEKVQQQMMQNMLESKFANSNPLEELSRRELEVMHLLSEGKWTKEIAIILNLKETTVSTYKARVFEKLNVSNIIEMLKKIQLYSVKDLDLT